LRIIVCCNQFPSVSETFVTSQVIGLERRGHTVAVVAEEVNRSLLERLPGGGPSGGVLALIGDETTSRSAPGTRLRLLSRSLMGLPGLLAGTDHPWRYARRGLRWTGLMAARAYALAGEVGQVDLVHAHMGPTALWARAVAARKSAPFAVTFHGSDATRYPAEVGWSVYRCLLDPPAATLVTHSAFVDRTIRGGLGVGTERVSLGVDTSLFMPLAEADQHSASRRAVRLVAIGRLVPKKGMRIAVEALSLLDRGGGGDRLEATLDIVGEGPEADSLALLATALGVESRCRLRGPQAPAAVAGILSGADLLLVPSLTEIDGGQEAFGLVCLEAQACGVLVVGTTCGGLPDAVAPPVGGLCVPEQSALAMATAVRELIGRPDQRALRAAARARVIAAHTEENYLAGYEQIFERMLDRAAASPPAVGIGPGTGEVVGEGAATAWEGSLPAYVIGRDVFEVRRRPSIDRWRWSPMARSWTTASMDEASAESTIDCGPANVVLDLDGAPPERLAEEWTKIAGTIGSGGIAMIAVRGNGNQAERVRSALAGDFRRIVLLDRLFFPGDRGDVTHPSPPLPGGVRVPPQTCRYLLCLR